MRSLEEQSYQMIETIFVDDESTDGSPNFVKRNFPRVMVVQNTRIEKGYAACCDTGARLARGKYLCFLNVDIELDPDCIGRLVGLVESDDTIGVCGPKLLSLNDRNRIVSTGGFLDIFGYGSDRGLDELDVGTFASTEDVNFITGAVLLIRSEALRAAGGWDVDTFTYAEDSDLCWRVMLARYRVVFEPSSIAYHLQSPSIGRASPRKIYFMERNRLSAMIKNYSLTTLVKVIPGWFFIAALRVLYFSLSRRADIAVASARAYLRVLADLPRTWRKRAKVQRLRKITDRQITRKFSRGSLEAQLFLSKKSRLLTAGR